MTADVLTLRPSPDAAGPAGACAEGAGASRQQRLRAALTRGFGVQYWGRGYHAAALAAQPHGLLILEATREGADPENLRPERLFSPGDVAAITRGGRRPALAYLNLAELEPYRDYWIGVAAGPDVGDAPDLPAWVGPVTPRDEPLALYWTQAWQDLLLARIDRIMATGADGVFLDDVLHYYTFATGTGLRWGPVDPRDGLGEASAYARAMMALVVRLAERVRAWDCDALVVVNNGVYIGRDAVEPVPPPGPAPLFAAYRAAIDGILVESMLLPEVQSGALEVLREDYAAPGLAVLTVDFLPPAGDPAAPDVARAAAGTARALGFVPYLAGSDRFDRLWDPLTPSPGPTAPSP